MSVPVNLARKIDSLRAYLKGLALCKGIGITLVSLMGLYLLCALFDRTLHLPEGWRFVFLIASAGSTLAGIALLCICPVLRRYKDEHIALAVQEKYPELGDSLISAVELSKYEGRDLSRDLIRAVGEEISRRTENLDFKVAAPRRGFKIVLLVLSSVVGAVCAYALASPGGASNVLARLLRPYAGIPPLTYTRLVISPGDTIVPRGENVAVSILTEVKKPRRALLYWSSEGTRLRRTKLTAGDDTSFKHMLERVMSPTSYWVRAGDATSRPFRVDVTDRPAVTNVSVEYAYPEYTGLGKKLGRDSTSDISGVQGTKVRLFAKASKEIVSASLETARPRKLLAMRIQDRNLEGPELLLVDNDSFSVRVKDRYGFSNQNPASHRVIVKPDETPVVRIIQPEEDIFITADEKVSIACAASDDFGIRDLSLSYKVTRKERKDPEAEDEEVGIALASGEKTTKEIKKEHLWAMAELALNPGDVIEYSAVATDYDSLSGPKKGKSDIQRIFVISREERWEAILRELAELYEQLRQLTEKQEKLQMKVENLAEKLSKEDLQKLKEEIEAELERQKKLERETRELSEELKDLMSKMARNRMGLESLASLDNTQRELADVAGMEMLKAAQELMRASGTPTTQSLKNASAEQLKAIERLQRLLKNFLDLLPQPATDKLLQQALALAIEQDEIRKDTRSLVPEMLGKTLQDMPEKEKDVLLDSAQKQEHLGGSTSDFIGELEKAREELEYISPARTQALSSAQERLESAKVPGEMEEIAALLKENRLARSLPREDRVSETLWQVVKDLSPQAGQGGSCQGDMQALYEALQQLAKIIEEQKRLNDGTRKVDSLRPSGELPRDLKAWLGKLSGKQGEIKLETRALGEILPARDLPPAIEKMGESQGMLKGGESGEKVQKVQEEIIDILMSLMQSGSEEMAAMGLKIPGSALITALGNQPGGYFTMAAPPATGPVPPSGKDTWASLSSRFDEELLQFGDDEYPPEFRDLLTLYYQKLGKP